MALALVQHVVEQESDEARKGRGRIVFLVLAYFAIGGVFLYPALTRDSWSSGDAVVSTVVVGNDPAGQTYIITTKGNVLHCTEAAECSGLEKGDHIVYEVQGAVRVGLDIHDVRAVTKG